MPNNEEAKQEPETPKTYDELLGAIERDITPRIVRLIPTTGLTEAIHEALHYPSQTRELIAQFVGWRHAELLERHAKEKKP